MSHNGRTIERFANKSTADQVAEQMQKMTDARIYVSHDPRKRGVGDWVVEWFPQSSAGHSQDATLARCAQAGLEQALAIELRKSGPRNPLLQTWRLKEGNSGTRYDVYRETCSDV